MKFLLFLILLAWPTDGFLFKAKKKIVVAKGLAKLTGAAVSTAALAYWLQRQSQSSTIYTPDVDGLQGQTILITGGTTGLGLETAKRLSIGNPDRIIITARSGVKGETALADIQSYMKDNNVSENVSLSYKVLDLDDLQGVQAAVASWTDVETINCLVNNAGVMAVPKRELTIDGFERQMQSNHLGHFVLTALLAPKLTKDARIVNVSSEAHLIARFSGMDFDYCWTGEPGYGAWRSYGQSKLANILFSQELQRRADESGLDWKVSTLHPGAVSTDLARNLLGLENWERLKNASGGVSILASSVQQALNLFLKTPEQGASTSVFLAAGATPDEPRGRYYVDCQPRTVNDFARDATSAKRLWDESEVKSGVAFTLMSAKAAMSENAVVAEPGDATKAADKVESVDQEAETSDVDDISEDISVEDDIPEEREDEL